MECYQPKHYVAHAADCNDADAAIHPDADEYCDGVDHDCDGATYEDESVDASVWYIDADGDGFGDAGSSRAACSQPKGYEEDDQDCNDGDAAVSPDAAEYCDGVDNDCDDETDEDDALDASTWYADSDGDGYGDPDVSTTACSQPSGFEEDDEDCDDGESAVNPDAEEVCDVVDNDCDDEGDEDDAVDASTWYQDADGDRYGDPDVSTSACDQPSGYEDDDEDCDDGDSSSYPGADEYCDGVDHDCDGATDEDEAVDASTWYLDSDGDAYGAPNVSQNACTQPSGYLEDDQDCDDGDAAINPGATEVCDSVDDDCDGVLGGCGFEGDYLLSDTSYAYAGSGSEYAGSAVSFVPDMDGDGDDEILIGAQEMSGMGGAYLFFGDASGSLSLASGDVTLTGEASTDRTGKSVDSAGDHNGDGFNDLLVVGFNQAQSGSGVGTRAYVVTGPLTAGSIGLATAFRRISDTSADVYGDASIAGVGDVNVDGCDDFLVGYHDYSSSGSTSDPGHAYLFLGTNTGSTSLVPSDGDLHLYGETADARASEVAGPGDVNADGFLDLAVGARFTDIGGASAAGAAYVVHSPITGELDLADADTRLVGYDSNNNTGTALDGAGDVNADGYADLVIGAAAAQPNGYQSGEAYLFYGASSGILSGPVTGAAAIFEGVTSSTSAGGAVSYGGDVDGDGYDDILIGAQLEDSQTSNAGATYLLYGPLSGTMVLDSADAIFYGEQSSGYSGAALDGGGDADGDGLVDLLIGAYRQNSDGGAVYLFLGSEG